MKKPTVLLISFVFSPNIGGVESHLDDLCSYLTKNNFKVVVITYQPIISKINAPSFEKKKNLEIRRIPWIKFNLFNRLEKLSVLQFLYLVPTIFLYSSFYLLKNKNKIDIIQTHGFNMAFVGAACSLLFRKKFNVNTHVSFNFNKKGMYEKILRIVLNKATKILVLTSQAKRELVKIGVNQQKIVVYHQWIDQKLFSAKGKNQSRKKLGLPENKFIVLFTGRFVQTKGVNLLLEAAKRVKDSMQFVFVGSGPLKESIKSYSKDNSRIRFVGEIKKEDLPYYYSSADVSIIPSIGATKRYSEGIPRVMIEAFTCGTPVISTRVGGAVELINKNVGFFVSPKSKEIANLLNNISKEPAMLAKMSKECPVYAQKEFGLVNNAKIIEQTLQ
ncbi:MAG: glycosyltransferase family 4 protein [Candidatus Levybacteria bacterium]|nr:glycosyltransferase family 4 protein [Candidatus Levybacteria bacterium]